jgi:hypothetical protein
MPKTFVHQKFSCRLSLWFTTVIFWVPSPCISHFPKANVFLWFSLVSGILSLRRKSVMILYRVSKYFMSILPPVFLTLNFHPYVYFSVHLTFSYHNSTPGFFCFIIFHLYHYCFCFTNGLQFSAYFYNPCESNYSRSLSYSYIFEIIICLLLIWSRAFDSCFTYLCAGQLQWDGCYKLKHFGKSVQRIKTLQNVFFLLSFCCLNFNP